MRSRLAVLVFLAILSGGTLGAATIFDGGTYDKTLYASASNTNCGPDCQVAAAQFSLAGGLNVITDVHWFGSYSPSVFPDNFTINIFGFVSGNPSTIPADTFNIGSTATRTSTGDNYTYNSAPIYAYDVVIPATTLVPGAPYLLSIVYNTAGDTSKDWGWCLGGSTAIGWSFTQNLGWDETSPNQFQAFSLTGPSSVPEPASVLLLGSGLIGIIAGRRKSSLS
jgi:hypothetical protein